jgi:hypothetical protein
VPGREAGSPDPSRERQQLGEAKAAVAADTRVRRLTARVAAHERRDDRAPEFAADVQRDVRYAALVAQAARREYSVR